MTRDAMLNRSAIGRLALILMFGIHPAAVRADGVQPLPRLTAGDDVRRLEHLPPTTQPLPRSIDVAQSDTGSLQEALKLLESRVESGAFESAPSAAEADEKPAREPVEQREAVSAPQSPATLEPPVAPAPPVMPAAPDRTFDSPSPATDKPADIPSPLPRAPEQDPPSTLETAPDKTAEPATPAASAGRWQVQLLAGRSLSRVERDRDDILRFHGDRVAGLTLAISQASPNGRYRLRALDWSSPAEAGVWCRHLRAATGLKCMVVHGDGSPDPSAAPVDTSPSPAR
ncbi:MAG: SPOR domain-containing protein [Chromatiales bacterium]|nr:SPOR domain-containing protein [Chromatiales bacterium]